MRSDIMRAHVVANKNACTALCTIFTVNAHVTLAINAKWPRRRRIRVAKCIVARCIDQKKSTQYSTYRCEW